MKDVEVSEKREIEVDGKKAEIEVTVKVSEGKFPLNEEATDFLVVTDVRNDEDRTYIYWNVETPDIVRSSDDKDGFLIRWHSNKFNLGAESVLNDLKDRARNYISGIREAREEKQARETFKDTLLGKHPL